MAVLDVVIDTNVVLDTWVFRDPVAAPLATAVAHGRLRWISTAPMLEELRQVLRRPPAERWSEAFEQALTSDLIMEAARVDPTIPGASGRLICSDPNDQKFIDLALGWPATALLTRDRALLKLARRARLRGVMVAPPAAWLRAAGLPP